VKDYPILLTRLDIKTTLSTYLAIYLDSSVKAKLQQKCQVADLQGLGLIESIYFEVLPIAPTPHDDKGTNKYHCYISLHQTRRNRTLFLSVAMRSLLLAGYGFI
jgi:hypothetical protein